VVSACAPITRQSWKRGACAAASAVWMKAARSTGRNRPDERRLLSTTPAMSRPSRCASPLPAKSGTAIGIGSVRARVMSITAPWARAPPRGARPAAAAAPSAARRPNRGTRGVWSEASVIGQGPWD
jgi:hypothetical protein